jgi:hypothetical protein
MQFLSAGARRNLDAMPHDKIVRAKFLKFFVGSTVLKKGVLPELEEDRRGDCVRPVPCQNNETETLSNHMLVNVKEKRGWLRRNTVTPSGLHMQLVKIANGLAIGYDKNPHAAAFRFAYRPANRASEASHQLIRVTAQIQGVPVKPHNRPRGKSKKFSSPYLKVSPTPFPCEANKLFCYNADRF